MSESIGGAIVKDINLTYSWGGTPASASCTAKGSSSLTAGDPVNLTIDALSFFGSIVADPSEITTEEGQAIKFQIVDNREKLKESIVLCRFNKMIIIEDDPSTPGIDRTKKYEHIYPGDDWQSQTRTVTSAPLSARQVLDKLFTAPTVTSSWTRTYHAAQSKPCHEIDCNHGKKLLNAVQEVTDSQGLMFTLVGESTLVWGRKGTDSPPTPNSTTDYNKTSGHSLNTNDTAITVVGDANRYQELSIELEPDWAGAWQAFWLEADWMAEVNTRFGPFADDDAGHALLAAKMRSVTVRDYVNEAGNDYRDLGKIGDVLRMEIPAWIYLTRVVWHAYRVPRSYTINGIPLANLTLVDEMLLAVEADIDTGTITPKSPDELYPDGFGFVVAKGQQIGLIDPRTQRYITPEQLTNARTKWTMVNRYTIDKKNNVVFLEDATFVPGEDADALFLFPNQSTDVDAGDPMYNLAVPNHACSVEPATVRASLVFDAELYSKAFGSGRRAGAEYVSGLGFHSILDSGANVRQIMYDDGQGADDKAADYAASKIANQTSYTMGGFDRKGAAGTALNTSIDRITVTYSTGGTNERIEYAKERGPSHFTAEDELTRRQKEKDRYPGERKLQQEVRELNTMAELIKGAGPRRGDGIYTHAGDVMNRPVGNIHPSPSHVSITDEQRAGWAIFIDDSGAPTDSGRRFAGIVVADGISGRGIALATQGVVPVVVESPFSMNDPVGMDDDGTVRAYGKKNFGVILGEYFGSSSEVLVEVRLNGGGAEAQYGFFEVIPAKPPEGHEGETGWVKVVPTGTVQGDDLDASNNVEITGLDNAFQLAIADNQEQYVYLYMDVTSLFDSDTPGPVTGQIGHGVDWNGESGAFFPKQYEFDTDDGTLGDAPQNAKPISCYVPLARTWNKDSNPLAPIEPTTKYKLTKEVVLGNLQNSNYRLDYVCAEGKTVAIAVPWTGTIQG